MTHPTIRRLNAEWELIAPHPLPAGWRRFPVLRAVGSLAELLPAIRAAPDPVLRALLSSDEEAALAQRVVLQAMLGRAVLDAARDRLHGVDDYVGELWLVIAGYPLVRRPSRIAANLALDTRKRVWRRASPASDGVAEEAGVGELHPSEELEHVLRQARRQAVIDPTTERVLRLVYSEDLPSEEAARRLGVSGAVVRQRCRRGIQRLAGRSADLAVEAVSPGYWA